MDDIPHDTEDARMSAELFDQYYWATPIQAPAPPVSTQHDPQCSSKSSPSNPALSMPAQLEQDDEASTQLPFEQVSWNVLDDIQFWKALFATSESPGSSNTQHRARQPLEPVCFDHGCKGRRFSSFESYRRHIREKNTTRSVKCIFCNTSFTRKSNLMQHLSRMRCKATPDMCSVGLVGRLSDGVPGRA